MQIGPTSTYTAPFTPDDPPGSQTILHRDPALTAQELKALQAKMPAPLAIAVATAPPIGPETSPVAGPISDPSMLPLLRPEVGPITDRAMSPAVRPPVSLTLEEVLSKLEANGRTANPGEPTVNGVFGLRARFQRLVKQRANVADIKTVSADNAHRFETALQHHRSAQPGSESDVARRHISQRFNRIG